LIVGTMCQAEHGSSARRDVVSGLLQMNATEINDFAADNKMDVSVKTRLCSQSRFELT